MNVGPAGWTTVHDPLNMQQKFKLLQYVLWGCVVHTLKGCVVHTLKGGVVHTLIIYTVCSLVSTGSKNFLNNC